ANVGAAANAFRHDWIRRALLRDVRRHFRGFDRRRLLVLAAQVDRTIRNISARFEDAYDLLSGRQSGGHDVRAGIERRAFRRHHRLHELQLRRVDQHRHARVLEALAAERTAEREPGHPPTFTFIWNRGSRGFTIVPPLNGFSVASAGCTSYV